MTNGDPLKDLKTAMRPVASASGFSADTVVIGQLADEQTYEDATGTRVPFCDPKCVLIAASGSQNTMAYAGVPQAEDDHMVVFEGRRIPLVYFDKGEDYRKLRLSSRPVPISGNTASWTVLQVLA
jgi:hypothetical protein